MLNRDDPDVSDNPCRINQATKCVLCSVLVVVGAKIFPWPIWIRRVVADRVVFVVAHDRAGGPCFDHRSDDLDNAAALRTAIDEITNEERDPIRMGINPVSLDITEPPQQPLQGVGATVDVSNDVETSRFGYFAH